MAIETLMHNTNPLGALLGDASDIIFDNGGTSLESTDVEGALKEVNSAIPNVVDNLTSTSTTDALSAKQGKVLNEKFEGITFTGLLSSGVSSTGTEVEGTLSESVDNFDLIVIVFTGSGGTQCCSMVIPTRYSNRAFYGDIVQSSNVYSYGEVKVNGNKIYVKANSFSGWSGFLVSQAYGIKL